MLLANWGCGALFRAQYQWPEGMDKANITRKELIPIILPVAIWGHEWSRKTIVAQCDNLAVVEVLNRGYSREPDIMHLMLRGIRSTQSKNRGAGRIRLLITPPILRKIGAVWNEDPTNFDRIMLWAASTLCFFGFFRAGEITTTCMLISSYDPGSHLSLDDIAVDNPAVPSILQVHLKVSKTNSFCKSIDVYIACTNDDLCPVAAMMAYFAVRGNNPGELFRFMDGHLLSRVRFVKCKYSSRPRKVWTRQAEVCVTLLL